jgi:hypothetical protein
MFLFCGRQIDSISDIGGMFESRDGRLNFNVLNQPAYVELQ